ncbi:MAG: cAMP phosphodiesterase [Cyanobium sp.]
MPESPGAVVAGPVLQQDAPQIASSRVRLTAGRSGLLLLPLALLMAAGPALAAPATEADMSLYTRIAALNVCISRAAGVEFDKAVAVAGETIAQVIQGQHGGQIAQVGPKALTIEELRKGSINSAVLGAVEVCPKEVPAEVKKKVDEVLKSSGSPAPAGPATKPAPAGRP